MSHSPQICAMLVLTVHCYRPRQTNKQNITLRDLLYGKLYPVQMLTSVEFLLHYPDYNFSFKTVLVSWSIGGWLSCSSPCIPRKFIKQLGSSRAPCSLKTWYAGMVGWLWGLLRPKRVLAPGSFTKLWASQICWVVFFVVTWGNYFNFFA